jgi:hypothetical protein
LTALLLAGLLLAALLALAGTSLLASLAALLALAAALTLLSALAALLSGTIRFISHGEFSALVDRGCAPTSEPLGRGLVPLAMHQMLGITLQFYCSGGRHFTPKSFSNRARAGKGNFAWRNATAGRSPTTVIRERSIPRVLAASLQRSIKR